MIKKIIDWFRRVFLGVRKKLNKIIYNDYKWKTLDAKIFQVLNDYRIESGLTYCMLAPNRWDAICYSNVERMETTKIVSHAYFTEREEQILLDDKNAIIGEIIAFNFSTANSYLHAWKNSESHNRIILGDYNKLAIASSEDGKYVNCIFIKT